MYYTGGIDNTHEAHPSKGESDVTQEPPRSREERRKYPRLILPIMVRTVKGEEARHPTHDLSLGGVRIRSNRYLAEGKMLEIELFLPQGSAIKTLCRVVWSQVLPPGSDAMFEVALQFMDLPDEASDRLAQYLEPDAGEA